MDIIINILSMTVPFSVALLLASIGEMFNQRSGVFNLGCEGVMSMGAFVGMLVPFIAGQNGALSNGWNWLGLLLAALMGAVLGLFFGVIVVTFRAPQGIAGIGLQMFGVGTAGTLFRHFVGGTQSIPGMPNSPLPLLSKIPFIGPVFFSHNMMVYLAFLFVPVAWYILFKTSWGLRVRAVGTHPRAADSMGINVNRAISLTFAIGSAVAAVGGILAAFDFRVYPSMGTMTGLKAFVAAVIGGIGNIQGAMIGGVLLGILEAVGAPLLHIPNGMKDTVAFAVLIIVLLVKPDGILGKNEREKV